MRFFLRVLATVYLAYLAVVFLLLNPALNILPAWYLKETHNRELRSESIVFNPFTIALEARGVALPEHSGDRFLEISRATIDLSTESLWQQGWVFDELSVLGLYLHARQIGEDEFNFSDMLPPAAPEPEPEATEDASIPGLTIHYLAIQAIEVRASLETGEEVISSALQEIDVEVTDLSTIIEEGRPYVIRAAGEDGGKFLWEGLVSVPGAYSEGFLQISNMQLRPLWRVAKQWLNFELREGRLGIEGGYRVDWGEELRYAITGGVAQVSQIELLPIDQTSLPDTSVGLGLLSIAGMDLDSATRHLSVDGIEIDGLVVKGWLEDDRISLADMFAVEELPEGEEEPPVEENVAGEEETDSGPPWTADLAGARLSNSSISFSTPFTEPALLQVTPLEASLGQINWPLDGDTPVSFNMQINEVLSSGIEGSLALGTGNGTLVYHLTGLPLTWFNPNLPVALRAELANGRLATDGEVILEAFSPVQISNQGELSDFNFRLQESEDVLTSWKSLKWDALSVDLVDRDVILQKLSIMEYAGRIHIHEDGTINTQKVWQEEVGEQAEEVVEDLAEGKPWSFAIPQILIGDSEVDFMDESLPINFRTIIGDLNGEILGISTQPGAETKVDVRGSVDGYAPVTLAGTAQPLSEPPAVDLELNFSGVDLALLTPYSANYAGYPIERGLMNLKLDYVLQDQRLQGQNNLRISQLKLGDKVESEDAIDLPLKLALVLLTDSNGVIEMEVPVKGDVGDPEFDIGSVIGKTIVNIITKAATAPFKLLGSLVGSEEDLQQINFAMGSAELGEAGKAKLQQLSDAMVQRPQINLTVTGRFNPEADGNSLRGQALTQELIAAGLSEEDALNKTDKWVKAIEKRYRSLSLPEGESVSITQKYDALIEQTVLPEQALRDLVEARSVAVKSHLVNELGLPPNRAVIEKSPLDDPAQIYSGVELNIQN